MGTVTYLTWTSALASKVKSLYNPFPPPVPTGKIWSTESCGRLGHSRGNSEPHRDETESCDVLAFSGVLCLFMRPYSC